jgi:hypothetical protein
MSTSFESNIKRWVSLDNRVKALNDEAKALREEKSAINDNISQHIEANNLEKATIQISDGKLRYVTTKTQSPISLKYLESCLNDCISDATKVKEIMDYIKENREVKETTELKRYYNKKNKDEDEEAD